MQTDTLFGLALIAGFLYLCHRFFLFRVLICAILMAIWGGVTVAFPIYLAATYLLDGRILIAVVTMAVCSFGAVIFFGTLTFTAKWYRRTWLPWLRKGDWLSQD